MPEQPIIPFAPLKSRDGTLNKDALPRNLFVEASGKEISVFKRPGLLLWGTGTGTGSGQGMTDFIDANGNQRLFVAQGGTLFAGASLVPSATVTDVFGSAGYLQSGSGGSSPLTYAVPISFGGKLWLIGTQTLGATGRFTVHYSDDGENWTLHTDVAAGTSGYPPYGGAWGTCVHTVGGVPRVYLVAHGNHATISNQVWYTEDFNTWTQASSNAGLRTTSSNHIPVVVSHSDGKMYAFYADGGGTFIYSSTDGSGTWTTVTPSVGYDGGGDLLGHGAISLGGKLFVIGGGISPGYTNAKIYSSSDNGDNWAEVGTNVLPENCYAAGIVVSAGIPYIIGYYSGSGPTVRQRIYRGSTDLSTWTLLVTWTSEPTLLNSQPMGINGTLPGPRVAYFKNAFYAFQFTTANSWRLYKFASTGAFANVSLGGVVGNFFDFGQNYGRTQLAAHSEQALYVYTISSGTLAEVTDADYPGQTVPGFVVLDDYGFVMDPDGNIYNSANADFTSWAAADYIAAQFENDGGVALAKQGLYIVALGYYTTELFFDAGNASGSPLSPVQNGVFTVGCAHGRSVKQVENTLMWIAQSKGDGQSTTKGRFIAKLEGTNYQRISTPDIDRILDADDLGTIHACVYKVAGHSYYHLMLKTSGISLVFDMSTDQWYVWSTRITAATVTPSNVVTVNGTATATVTHAFADGDVGVVSGFTGTHTNLNGTFNMTVPSATVLNWKPSNSSYSGTATGTGTATSWAEDVFPIVASANYDSKQLMQDITSGNIFTLDPDTYQDNSIWMDFAVRLGRSDMGLNVPKFMAWADFQCDRNAGNILYRQSDDDCQSYTKYRGKSMDQERVRFNRLGRFHRRTMQYRVTDNIPARVTGLLAYIERGT